jgi:hypothetical protein
METRSVTMCKKKKKKKSKKPAKQIPSYEIKISYTLEDGQVGRNMLCKTVTSNTIKLHADGNITCKTH